MATTFFMAGKIIVATAHDCNHELTNLLRQNNYQVVAVENLCALVHRTAQSPFDLAVVDQELTVGLPGLMLAAVIKQYQCPVLLLAWPDSLVSPLGDIFGHLVRVMEMPWRAGTLLELIRSMVHSTGRSTTTGQEDIVQNEMLVMIGRAVTSHCAQNASRGTHELPASLSSDNEGNPDICPSPIVAAAN